jgi:anti-anti-sigma regulatory factor
VGRVDRAAISQVKGAIRGFRATGVRDLVIDLSAATECDGRLLTVLASARAQLADDAGALTITGARLPQFLTAMLAATVEEVFVLYDALRRGT